jgi:predicted TIM-barrel fold metal-dependent hydrolase
MSTEMGGLAIVDGHTCVGTRPEDDRDLGATALGRAMARHDIADALVTHFAAIRYDARDGNDQTLALCAEAQGTLTRLHPVAVVHAGMHVGVDDEIHRCARAGCVAVRLTPSQQGWSPAAASFDAALWAIRSPVAAADLPVIVEVGAIGEATTVARAAEGLDLTLVLSNVSYPLLGEAIAVLEQHPGMCLEACRLVTPGVVELLVDHVGAQRLIFGSGAPAWDPAPTLAMIREADIADADKAAILGGNARRLFRLPAGGDR